MTKFTILTPKPVTPSEKQKLDSFFAERYGTGAVIEYGTDKNLQENLVVSDGKNESAFTKITIVSSVELTAAQKQRIEETFRKKYGHGIPAEYLIDDSLIGGLLVFDGKTVYDSHAEREKNPKHGHRTVYDGSVKTKLESIKERLIHGHD